MYYALRVARLVRRVVRVAFFVALAGLRALTGALRTMAGVLNFDSAVEAFSAMALAAVTTVARFAATATLPS
jgi:hypothetical protein